MVLRDVNYYLQIFAGQCVRVAERQKCLNFNFLKLFLFLKEHSWRHKEFKKYSNKSSKILYSKAAICSYRTNQYMSATNALQDIFSKRNNNQV